MKRAKHLFERIPLRANLLMAVQKALRGKRAKGDAKAYVADLDTNLNELADQIRSGDLRVGKATQFTIHDPKERLITAPCFAERVLHHSLMNICEPEFEQRLIYHTYACRRGKGQFAALEAAQKFARGHAWFLKMDVRKYFDSIPKDRLMERLGRVFAEAPVLNMFAHIIQAHQPSVSCGLPIGSLISQHCANLYLDVVDRHVTQMKGCGAYVRYMDDFVVWSHDKAELKEVRASLLEVLSGIGLTFKQEPYLNRTALGMDFLGHRVMARGAALNRRSRRRFQTKLKQIVNALARSTMSEADAQARLTALCAFTLHFGDANTRRRAMNSVGCVPLAPTA